MAMVRHRRVFVVGVTLQTDAIAGSAQLRAMRLMAIAAGDAGCEHLALLERPVIVDLVEHLPVSMIAPRCQRRDDVRVGKPSAWHPILGKTGSARMAQAASLNLLAQRGGREAPCGVAGPRIDRPCDVAPFVERNEQPLARVFDLAERPPASLPLRPVDVARPLPVTALTADADLREGRGKAVSGRVIVLAHAGRMAFRTHEIPVLVQLGPIQDVVVLDLL